MSQIFTPDTIEDTCALLSVPHRMLCAGATNLYVDRYLGKDLDSDLISLHKLKELKYISQENDGWHIGSLCTFDMLENELADCGVLDALSKASSLVGGPQVRNRGTIGGNIVSASPSADSVPVLMALDANVVLKSGRKERVMPIVDFMTGVKRTAIHSDELLTEIIIPKHTGQAAFRKIGKRNALAIALCNLCVYMEKNTDRSIAGLNIAIGSCAPTCVRAVHTERELTGRKYPADEAGWNEIRTIISDHISKDISPIDDVRTTASYRQKVAANVVFQLVKELWQGKS